LSRRIKRGEREGGEGGWRRMEEEKGEGEEEEEEEMIYEDG